MRKIIFPLLIFIAFFALKTTIAYAGPDDACTFTTDPTQLQVGKFKSITFTNIRDAGTRLYVAFNTSNTGPCPLDSLTKAGKFQEGCVSEDILINPDSGVTFSETDHTLGDLRNLGAGTYTVRLCVYKEDGTCQPSCRSNGIVVRTAGGQNPSPEPTGPGQNNSCEIDPTSNDYKICSKGGRVRGTCSEGFYCNSLTTGDCRTGTCVAGSLYDPSVINYAKNAPLSLPCEKNGNFYNDARGCLRVRTAFGMVSTGATDFTRWALGFVLSIGGGIIFIIILVAGYKLMTSQGDPDKVKNAREQLTAAIVGFIFIIFSLVILELITRDILGLPGFGR